MKEISVSPGLIALVDDEDYERLSRFKWHSRKMKRLDGSIRIYAVRNKPRDGTNKARSKITMHGEICGYLGPDHKDGNGLNNQRSNLRRANHSEQNCNKRGWSHRKGSARFKGVFWSAKAKKWGARISKDKKTTYLGYFKDEVDAAAAYNFAAQELHGEFARLNCA